MKKTPWEKWEVDFLREVAATRPYNNKPCRCHSRSKIRGKEIKTYG
nr:MAG TPA: hypothetical protein [Caudoviricetes sp.]